MSPFFTREMLRALLVFTVLCASPVLAQEAGSFGESIDVRRVDVDVVVTDADGVSVRGLTREDFALEIDGAATEIRNFSERSDDPLLVLGKSAIAGASDAASETVESRDVPVTWVVYVDSGMVAQGPKNDALKKVAALLGANTRPEDRFMVVTFDGQRLMFPTPLGRFATDRAELERSISAIRRQSGDGDSRRMNAGQLLSLLQQTANGDGFSGSGVPLEVYLDQLLIYVEDEGRAARRSLQALDQFISLASGFEGQRVVVIQVGGDLPARPGEEMFERSRGRLGLTPDDVRLFSIQQRISNLGPEVSAVLQHANAGRMTFYTIDTATDSSFGVSPVEDAGLPGTNEAARAVPASATSSTPLSTLAAATGGRAFHASPELATRLLEVTQDLNHYYSLAYEPSSEKQGYHRVKVKMTRPGLVAHQRDGVAQRGARAQGADAALTALLDSTSTNNLHVSAAITAGTSKSKTIAVQVQLPLSDLVFAPPEQAGGVHRAKISFHFAIADASREFRRLDSKNLEFTVPDEKLETSRHEHVVYTIQLPATFRGWRLAIVAVDEIGAIRSSIVIPVT
ncbi:MAG: VWA domain-containing protein [Thermoanaerobaculia bacterium]